MINIILRAQMPNDFPFIHRSWLKSFHPKAVLWKIYSSYHSKVIKRILEKATVVIAVNPKDDDQIFGFICYEPDVLHYCYVKEVFRNQQIGQRLLEVAFGQSEDVMSSHFTKSLSRLEKGREIYYNPYLIKEYL